MKAELSKEAIETRRAYYRNYREANKGKYKQYNNKYWERKAANVKNKEQEG